MTADIKNFPGALIDHLAEEEVSFGQGLQPTPLARREPGRTLVVDSEFKIEIKDTRPAPGLSPQDFRARPQS